VARCWDRTAQNIPGGTLDRSYLDNLFHDLSADAEILLCDKPRTPAALGLV
jgi:hypothetical protein